MTKDQKEQEGFKITDKRSFQEDGEERNPDVAAEEDQKSPDPPSSEQSKRKENASNPDEQQRPPIDFPSYLLSYYTQGMVLLGEVPNPYTNKKEEDMEAARHTIDILSMLEEKTKGNLSQDEQKLLENVLYELRMKYMAKSNRIKI
ncbi:MAG: DUF1844 domain-containing protein [Acidobacteriota bacterium]